MHGGASFAAAGEDAGDAVLLEITDASFIAGEADPSPPPPVSVDDLAGLDPLPYPTIWVRADRTRLIESSSYFRALLGGSFSESGRAHVQISCNLEAAVQVLIYLFEPSGSLTITHHTFLPLMEGGLFLAAENLLTECERWFRTMSSQSSSLLAPLDFLIDTWYFAQEHGINYVQDICPGYLAQNFVQVISRRSFVKLPYDLLYSTIECPFLTVDSEKQLCEAILCWITENMLCCEELPPNSVDHQLYLLNKVRICLLPLEFAAGTKRNWAEFGSKVESRILNLLKDSLRTVLDAIADDNLESYRVRITEYSKKIVLSGCPQITTEILYISVLPPTNVGASLNKRLESSWAQVDYRNIILYNELEEAVKSSSFGNVHMVDLSKCPNAHFSTAIDWLKLAFPELRIFRASFCLTFQFEDLLYLLLTCPWINEIDLSIDTSIIAQMHSVISSRFEGRGAVKPKLTRYYAQDPLCDTTMNSYISNISKLILEGRNDITDVDLLKISILKNSLCYINIKNCTLLTDDGISKLLLKCTKIHSMVLSYTSFGNQSIQTLCNSNPLDSMDECRHVMAFRMQELHLDGCKGIGYAAMSQLMSNVNITNFLCLRETTLTDGALCNFVGSSLEFLDISETVVSMVSLAPVIRRNSNLRCLKAAGCRNLLFEHGEVEAMSGGNIYGDFLQEITSTCCLEDVEMGWAFCPIRVTTLIPSFSKVRKMTIGLGTTLPENILCALPDICPFLESLVLRFQMISDKVVRNLLKSSTKLRVLCLYSCLGNLTSFSFQIKAPLLRILRLEWITPWMTNDDLAVLIQNYNLVELSLSGCKLLDSNSQELISSGWPNLTCLHLEECGQITLDGVSSILNCKALEDLLLRHTGKGIGRTIITDAITELPLLRKLALDLCDASEEGYDSPNNPEGKMMRTITMSRCKSVRSCFELHREGSSNSKPVHKETIVLEWSSRQLRTTIVKEKIRWTQRPKAHNREESGRRGARAAAARRPATGGAHLTGMAHLAASAAPLPSADPDAGEESSHSPPPPEKGLRKVVVVMGATGAGKSRLAVDLASHFAGVEVVSADSMQVYGGLDVLTNKVPLHEQKGVPHHLLSVIDPSVEFTCRDFRDHAVPIIEGILDRGGLPVIVGGTNFYIQALVSPFLFDDMAQDIEGLTLNDHLDEIGLDNDDEAGLYEHLKKIDPVAAQRIHPNNHRKIKRYLELYESTGALPSDLFQGQATEMLIFMFWIVMSMKGSTA
ncbi:BTB/POZ domain-containing protein FBL11 isoform X3 [Oryza sativa Japonica Group]|uniref:BTB/POZ domain-containing protein FBL11 isoform X3 n=1 Tax=Oryza sativa subsp. japonica TaxID=39947 RepID=UPI0007753A2B|nr:BTB/POZ domain-containing protein FBL11 isoform X3 [Oryza sativa Japonica Group]